MKDRVTMGDLFEERRHEGRLVGYGPARARESDGGGSHEAAAQVEPNAKQQRRLALKAVEWRPGATSKELAADLQPGNEAARLKLYDILKRRLPELRDGSPPLVRSVPGRGARSRTSFRWWPA